MMILLSTDSQVPEVVEGAGVPYVWGGKEEEETQQDCEYVLVVYNLCWFKRLREAGIYYERLKMLQPHNV